MYMHSVAIKVSHRARSQHRWLDIEAVALDKTRAPTTTCLNTCNLGHVTGSSHSQMPGEDQTVGLGTAVAASVIWQTSLFQTEDGLE